MTMSQQEQIDGLKRAYHDQEDRIEQLETKLKSLASAIQAQMDEDREMSAAQPPNQSHTSHDGWQALYKLPDGGAMKVYRISGQLGYEVKYPGKTRQRGGIREDT